MQEIIKALWLIICMQKPAKTLSYDYFDYILKINTEEQVLAGICPNLIN